MRAGLTHRRAIIVGAGQSGLAVAAALAAEGLRPQHEFVVIDAASTGQRSWSSRWHSMELLSDARHSALSPRRLLGDQRRHPRVDEMADYLTFVEAGLGVETVWGIQATGVEHRGNGSTLLLSTTAGEVQTRNLICATGAAAHPRIPEWASLLTVPGVVLHSSEYLYPKQIPTGDVLVVGGGNSGVQLARELSASHTVTLSVRTRRQHRPAMSYPAAAGERVPLFSRERRPEPVFGDSYEQLRRVGVTIAAAVQDAAGAGVTFADGTQASPRSVILATGYTPGDDWLPEPARVDRPRRTLTGLPGLFVAGMPQYGGRGSDTLAGVWKDATTIAQHIINRPTALTTVTDHEHPHRSGSRRRVLLLSTLTTLLLAVGLLFATAAPAAAHDEIVSSSPEAGSTVSVAPEEISLTFSGEILTDFSAVIIEVVAPDGQNIASGDPVIDGTTVTQAVTPGQAGVYTVRWRVVSSDGHPISNEYQYTVEAVTVPTSAPTPEATEEQTPDPSPTSAANTSGEVHNGPSGGGELLPVLAVLSGVIVLGGALVVVLMVARERRRRDRAAAAAAAADGGTADDQQQKENPS